MHTRRYLAVSSPYAPSMLCERRERMALDNVLCSLSLYRRNERASQSCHECICIDPTESASHSGSCGCRAEARKSPPRSLNRPAKFYGQNGVATFYCAQTVLTPMHEHRQREFRTQGLLHRRNNRTIHIARLCAPLPVRTSCRPLEGDTHTFLPSARGSTICTKDCHNAFSTRQ